jgi:carbon-monoxide dehydrogenase small subunit
MTKTINEALSAVCTSTESAQLDNANQPVELALTVNGRAVSGRCEPRKLLVDFLREDLALTGTHAGCEHGLCGACTVHIDGQAARSCTTLAVQVDGSRITTIEGLAGEDNRLHPLQQAFHEHHALQCGFCTPGMLMTALDFLDSVPDPDEAQIRDAMSAVICRCTGYQGIVAAVTAVAQQMSNDRRNTR